MEYEYKIYRSELGWQIYRKKQIGRLMILQYLNGHGLWTPNKGAARTFYHEGDAISALTVMKKKDEKNSDK